MSSTRAIQAKEREVQAKRLGKLAKALLMSLATILTFAVVILLITDKLYRPDSFVIAQVKIAGKFEHSTVEEVHSRVLEEDLGNFFSVDLEAIQERVLTLPWVREANVRREWPNGLSVKISEHRPVLRWQSLSSLDQDQNADNAVREQWVSAQGEVVSVQNSLQRNSPITIKGLERDAQKILTKTLLWRRSLADVGLRLYEVSLTPSQAWHLQLAYLDSDEKFELLLGRQSVEDRLSRFRNLFVAEFKNGSSLVVRADARYPDGLAVVTQRREPVEKNEPVSAPNSSSVSILFQTEFRSRSELPLGNEPKQSEVLILTQVS